MPENLSRISLFWGDLTGGGIEHVMITLAEEFLHRGVETDIILLQRKGELQGRLPPDARVFNLEAERLFESVPALAEYFRDHHPFALLSAAPYLNRVALFARVLAGVSIPIVISEHNVSPIAGSNSFLPDWGLMQLTRQIYSLADRMIAASEAIAEGVSRSLELRREEFDIIYNPVVGPKTFELAEQSVDHPWFSDERQPVVLGAGRLVKDKGFSTLLRAFAQIRETRRARLAILGEGKKRPALEQEAKQLGVSDHVWMPGFVSNPMKYMADASVFVLSSKSEGLGNVLIEAMACGTPVVSTDCPGGPSEILEEGKYGKLVPVEDPTALATGIEAALDGDVEPAPRSALDRFRRDRVAEQYLNVLGSVV